MFAHEPNAFHDFAPAALVFPPCASFEKPYDLDIVRNIVEREGCIEALQQLLGAAKKTQQPRISGISKAPIVFQSIIDQLRSVSVRIVEDIDQWQQQQKAKAQATNFKWRGVNYLLKMTADLDFLASFRDVALLESLQVLRLMQNPFLALLHLDHPALRESDPESAMQLFGNWVGDVTMRRVFSASKLLLGERDAATRRQQIRLHQSTKNPILVSTAHSTGESGSDSAATVAFESSAHQQRREKNQISSRGYICTPLGDTSAPSNPREASMYEDMVLSRELITQAEHELGAMRDELAALQERLEDVTLPDKRRRLKIRIGSLVNDFKFRSGDLYQRRNELKRKEAVYRMSRDRHGSNNNSRSIGPPQPQSIITAESMRKEKIYSSSFETSLLEDEQIRNDLVSRMNASLPKARVDDHKRDTGLTAPNRRLQQSSKELQKHQLEDDDEIEQWGVREVQNFLDALGLDNGSYGANFRAQGIDGKLLLQATDRDLEELGVTIRLHRVRILRECKMRRDYRNSNTVYP